MSARTPLSVHYTYTTLQGYRKEVTCAPEEPKTCNRPPPLPYLPNATSGQAGLCNRKILFVGFQRDLLQVRQQYSLLFWTSRMEDPRFPLFQPHVQHFHRPNRRRQQIKKQRVTYENGSMRAPLFAFMLNLEKIQRIDGSATKA